MKAHAQQRQEVAHMVSFTSPLFFQGGKESKAWGYSHVATFYRLTADLSELTYN
jgi:hypothetical protein